MTKFLLILLSTTICTSVLATCSIENSNVCALPELRKSPISTYSKNTNVQEFSSNPETRLKPINRDDFINTSEIISDNQENKSGYNSNCQFGVCINSIKTPLFQQKK